MKTQFLSYLVFAITLSICSCSNDNAGMEPPDSVQNDVDTEDSTSGTSNQPVDTLLKQYDPPGRVFWQKPQVVIDKLGDLSDLVVADLGAGSGFFSRRLAQQAKKVIALEIDQNMIPVIDSLKRIELKPEYSGPPGNPSGYPN